MMPTISTTMRAVALDHFGGAEALKIQTLPVPAIGPDEVLVRVAYAGVGSWDPFEREGGYAEMLGMTPAFPYVLGSEGAGVIAAVGEQVNDFNVGDEVYASGFLNPKGGFYAQYAAVNAQFVSAIPKHLSVAQAGVMGGVCLTALRGLSDVLHLAHGESVMIFGASGGIGHVAVQFARLMGARVLGVASGDDGVALVRQLGADVALDGRKHDVVAAARSFAPSGVDAALFTAGGAAAEQALLAVRPGGRAAYPTGVQMGECAPNDVQLSIYNGEPDPEIIRRADSLAGQPTFTIHVAQTYAMAEAAQAHAALDRHYLGKIALHIPHDIITSG